MPKRKKVVSKPKPNLEQGLVITAPSLVVDKNGVVWLLNPFNGTIKRCSQ